MRKLVVQDWCDLCQASDQVTEAVAQVTLTRSWVLLPSDIVTDKPTTWVVDVCVEHKNSIEKELNTWHGVGRSDKAIPTTTGVAHLPPSRDVRAFTNAGNRREPCQFCGIPNAVGIGMNRHIKAKHPEQYEALKQLGAKKKIG